MATVGSAVATPTAATASPQLVVDRQGPPPPMSTLRAVVVVPRRAPRAGAPITVVVRTSSPFGTAGALSVDFGDGTKRTEPTEGFRCADVGGERTWRFEHAYRRPGRFPVTAALTPACNDPGAPSRYAHARLVVRPRRAASNGPQQPRLAPATHGFVSAPASGASRVGGWAEDLDGYLSEVRVDWGDEADESESFPLSKCSDVASRFPQSNQWFSFDHHYARPGPHRATVTFTSVGCDGRDSQVSSADLVPVEASHPGAQQWPAQLSSSGSNAGPTSWRECGRDGGAPSACRQDERRPQRRPLTVARGETVTFSADSDPTKLVTVRHCLSEEADDALAESCQPLVLAASQPTEFVADLPPGDHWLVVSTSWGWGEAEYRFHMAVTPEGGESLEPGRFHEFSDNGASFTYSESPELAAAASSTSWEPERTERLRFYLYGEVVEDQGRVRATLDNISGRGMRFPDGVRVVAHIARDGRFVKDVELTGPAVSGLAPGEALGLTTPLSLDGPGSYDVWGEMDIELV